MESLPLHIQKDRVWQQIFLVLHSVLDSLSRSRKCKFIPLFHLFQLVGWFLLSFSTFKFCLTPESDKLRHVLKNREPDIGQALEDMDAAIADYQVEVNIAAEQRMGRVEERGRRLSYTVNGFVQSFDGMYSTHSLHVLPLYFGSLKNNRSCLLVIILRLCDGCRP